VLDSGQVKTAKALGLDVPWFLQQRADEVIDEAPRVHHATRRHGGGMAARSTRAAVCDAGDWLHPLKSAPLGNTWARVANRRTCLI
jgi:hypothetical protein